MRSTMFTAHLKQFVNLVNPDFAYVFTNQENLVGKNSSGYKKSKSELTVIKKVSKFDDLLEKPNFYYLFVYDKKNKRYDVIERSVCGDLTENFGFDYNNDAIDSFKEGDTIPDNEILYNSTSYDKDMNYGYGKNVNVAYMLDPWSSEDAAIAAKSLCDKFTSIETETMRLYVNNNEFLLNLYGDKHNYKPLPDIGDVTSDIIAVTRQQINTQLLYDLKDNALKDIHDGDTVYYIDKNVEVIDYTIYNNNDELPDTPFYTQIRKYLDSQTKFYQEVYDTTSMIKDSGQKYTQEIEYLYKRSKEFLNTEKKWCDGNSNVYSNLEIEIKIHRFVPLAKGCKITGRFGNKSVISEIREDEDMPYTEDGRRVDLILNLLAINKIVAWSYDQENSSNCWKLLRA